MSPFAWKFVKIVTVDLEQEGTNMNYEELLDQLRTGELDQFVLEAKDFKEFYEVWRNYPYQNAIRGVADRGGVVTYTAKNTNE